MGRENAARGEGTAGNALSFTKNSTTEPSSERE